MHQDRLRRYNLRPLAPYIIQTCFSSTANVCIHFCNKFNMYTFYEQNLQCTRNSYHQIDAYYINQKHHLCAPNVGHLSLLLYGVTNLTEHQENPVTSHNNLLEHFDGKRISFAKTVSVTLLGITGLPHATLTACGGFLMLHLLCVTTCKLELALITSLFRYGNRRMKVLCERKCVWSQSKATATSSR